MTLVFWSTIIVTYLLGSISTTQLVARLSQEIDTRQYNSGSTSVSNLWHSISKWKTIPVIPLDLGKGMLMAFIAQQIGLDILELHKQKTVAD